MENNQDDPNQDDLDLKGQQDNQGEGNAQDSGDDQGPRTPTDVELEGGVKVSQATLDKWAKETYKDRFEAYDNREKWQAENTRRAQEIKQIERDAEAYRRLQSDPQFNRQQPDRSLEGQKRTYVDKKKAAFPDVDPRFFESQFDDIHEMAGRRASESIDPIRQSQAAEWERNFLSTHPLIKPGTDGYAKVAEYVGKGYDPEDAYEKVFRKEIMDKEFQDRTKARDEENKRKLKNNRTQSSSTGSKPLGRNDVFEKNWAKYGDAD